MKNDQEQSHRPLVPAERRRRVAEMLQESGSVSVQALEEEFGVSPMTARRDLSALEQQGRAVRTYGGAVVPGFARHEDSFQVRVEQCVEAKRRLAKTTVGLLETDQTIFVDSSSTAYYVARQMLEAGIRMNILTSLLPVMELFSGPEAEHLELIGIGGNFRKITLSFVGPCAVQAVRAHFSEKTIMSVKGVTRDGYLTDPDVQEAEVKREMIRRSEDRLLLVEGSKLNKRALNVVTHVSELSRVLVADGDGSRLAELESAGVEVLRV